MKMLATLLLLATGLILAQAPAVAQETDADVGFVAGSSDCSSQPRVIDNDGGVRQIIRCINGGIRQFAFGLFKIDENGGPVDYAIDDGASQDLVSEYADLGWGVYSGVLDLTDEINQLVTFYVFYRDDCVSPNCSIDGDDPATGAYLSLPVLLPLDGNTRVIPLAPDYQCSYGGEPYEPCWTYIDCDSVKHYAACVYDAAESGLPLAYPYCMTCAGSVNVQPTTWGGLKSRYPSKPKRPDEP